MDLHKMKTVLCLCWLMFLYPVVFSVDSECIQPEVLVSSMEQQGETTRYDGQVGYVLNEGHVKALLESRYYKESCSLDKIHTLITERILPTYAGMDVKSHMGHTNTLDCDEVDALKGNMEEEVLPDKDPDIYSLYYRGIEAFMNKDYDMCIEYMSDVTRCINRLDKICRDNQEGWNYNVEYWSARYIMAVCYRVIGSLYMSGEHASAVVQYILDLGPNVKCCYDSTEKETELLLEIKKKAIDEVLLVMVQLCNGDKWISNIIWTPNVFSKQLKFCIRKNAYCVAKHLGDVLLQCTSITDDSVGGDICMHTYLLRGIAEIRNRSVQTVMAGQCDLYNVLMKFPNSPEYIIRTAISGLAESFCVMQTLKPWAYLNIRQAELFRTFVDYNKDQYELLGQIDFAKDVMENAMNFVTQVYANAKINSGIDDIMWAIMARSSIYNSIRGRV